MKLHNVNLHNIKSFTGSYLFDFSLSDNINTVSGINGSGKTTVFKAVILAQKLFFAELLKQQNIPITDYTEDLLGVFSGANSNINLQFIFDDNSLAQFVIYCSQKHKEAIKTKIIASSEDLEKIKEYWNLENPRNLIVYIDSNKNISEENFSNDDFKLSQIGVNELALEYVFNPEKIFFSTYDRIIRDYIRERVIPSTPRADLPHFVSKIFIHDIIKYLKISKFTGLERQNQFILQVKNEELHSNLYDVRNLSSGEKTLFYIYHFICYVKNIGMLIIDEPENNLHENMLSKFVLSLSEICKKEKFSDLILDIAQKNNIKFRKNLENQIIKFYKDHKLSQVFLLTHSKNLIYNNFTLGKNYVVDRGLELMEYDSYEKKLREVGLSKIINKVIFVEGKTENEILENILSPLNIKVKPLGGCSEVIETYKKYLSLKDEIRDVQFCFMIDRDTRTDEDINKIRSKDSAFFDEHFIVMDRHEIENYFIEPKMFYNLYQKHKKIYPLIQVPKIDDIKHKIKTIADNNKSKVLEKKLQNLNQKSLANLKLAISKKNIPINSETDYEAYIDNVFQPESLIDTISLIKENYHKINEIETSWENDWIKLCDGKIVFYEFLREVSQDLGLHNKRLIKELQEIGFTSSDSELKKIIDKILSFFN